MAERPIPNPDSTLLDNEFIFNEGLNKGQPKLNEFIGEEGEKDSYGFGMAKMDSQVRDRLTQKFKSHVAVWDGLIGGRQGVAFEQSKKDWKSRAKMLMEDQAFVNFLESDKIQDKVSILRDTGLHPNFRQWNDADMLKYISQVQGEIPIDSKPAKNSTIAQINQVKSDIAEEQESNRVSTKTTGNVPGSRSGGY